MKAQSGQGFYYGWVIAVAAGFILLVTNGMTLAGLNVYDKPLLETLQQVTGEAVPLSALKFRDTITLLVGGLMAPLAGAAADRFGVRPLMVVGAILLSLGYFLYSRVDSLRGIYGIHVLFASTLATCGLLVNVILVSRWFVKNRGLALGIAVAGTSLGNGTLPPLNAALMGAFGWRSALAINSLFPLVLVPIILLLIRERPADKGLTPPMDPRRSAPFDPSAGMTLPEAVKTANFWILALVAMCTFFAIIGTQAHLNLYMLGRGFSQIDAGLSYAVLFYLGLVGKISSGLLADRIGRKPIFVLTIATMLVGAALLLLAAAPALWAALILFGLGWGGLYTLLQLLAADYFGPRDLGKILGVITVLDTLGGGLGPPLIGAIRDSLGAYDRAFMLVTALIAVALVLASQFRLSAIRAAA